MSNLLYRLQQDLSDLWAILTFRSRPFPPLSKVDPTLSAKSLIQSDPDFELAPGITRPTSLLIKMISEEMARRIEDRDSYEFRNASNDTYIWEIKVPLFLRVEVRCDVRDHKRANKPSMDSFTTFLNRIEENLGEYNRKPFTEKTNARYPYVRVELKMQELVPLNPREKMVVLRMMLAFIKSRRALIQHRLDMAAQKKALEVVELLLSDRKLMTPDYDQHFIEVSVKEVQELVKIDARLDKTISANCQLEKSPGFNEADIEWL